MINKKQKIKIKINHFAALRGRSNVNYFSFQCQVKQHHLRFNSNFNTQHSNLGAQILVASPVIHISIQIELVSILLCITLSLNYKVRNKSHEEGFILNLKYIRNYVIKYGKVKNLILTYANVQHYTISS